MKNYICLLCICWMQFFMHALANEAVVSDFSSKDTDSIYYSDLHKLRKAHPWHCIKASEKEISTAVDFIKGYKPQKITKDDWGYVHKLSKTVSNLAYAASKELPEGRYFNDFIETLFTDKVIEQIPNFMYSRYDDVRKIPANFLSALPVCNVEQQRKLIASVKHLIEFEKLYQDAATIRTSINTDYMYNVLPHLFACALYQPDKKQAIKDLLAFSHYLSACTQYSPGSKDGLKIDGTGFHHWTHYNGYMYAYKTWVQHMAYLKGTAFRIKVDAYQRMKKAIVSEYLMSTLPVSEEEHYFANSLSGRHPFAGLAVDFTQELFQELIEIGGDIEGKKIDEELAGYYNAFFQTDHYKQIKPKELNGFYQFNYSPSGIYRHDNWIATMRCPTTVFWGGEIYNKTNRFGRYQSHGTLEILYNGSLERSGYPSRWKRFDGERGGWDWNVVPGSTTVHYTDWDEMMPNGNTADRFDQRSATTNFSGALSWGDCGIFACTFDQDDHWGNRRFVSTNLTFCKSVFAFDGILVSLGSGISAQGDYADDRLTATNLFQALTYKGNEEFILNGEKLNEGDLLTLNTNKSNWLITPCTTGYLIPSKNDPLTIFYGQQTTPGPEGTSTTSFGTRCAAKAYINHGVKPINKKYSFAVIPNTTPKTMATLAKQLFHKKGLFEIKQQQDSLHILKHIPTGILAYALFAPTFSLQEGILYSSDMPLLLMERFYKKRNQLELAVCSPNLRPKLIKGNKEWIATPTISTLQLKGCWQVPNCPSKGILSCSYEKGYTKIILELKEGLPLYLKFNKANPNETIER